MHVNEDSAAAAAAVDDDTDNYLFNDKNKRWDKKKLQ